jgi:pimeloyl-ACP methyl ester carboxylesterase
MHPKMQTDVRGAGPTLVLVGGGLTGWASWEPHQARLSTTRTVARAQPLSVQLGLENLALPAGYSVSMEAQALGAAVDELTRPVDLVGWSYGAAISLAFALAHADKIRTLTLIEPPAFWVLSATGRLDARAQRESDELRLLYAGMTADVSEAQLADFIVQAGLCPPGGSPHRLPQWKSWVQHRRSLRTGDACWGQDGDEVRLRSFDRPALLVKGTGSTHFLHQIIDGLAGTLSKGTVVELPGAHAPQLAAMDAFLARLTMFLAEK